jgi:hypothetical protein
MPDLVIACVVLLICGGALALSFTYPPATAMLLPRAAAVLGVVGAAWIVVSKSTELSRRRVEAAVEDEDAPADLSPDEEEEVDPNDAEYVLSHTPRDIWLMTLGILAGFFLVLYLCGIFIAAGALSLIYLLIVGKKTWSYALIYTVFFTGSLWFVLRVPTYILTPPGVLIHGG